MAQVLGELRELKASFSTLAKTLFIIRRNQEDIKTRLTEIGLSVCSLNYSQNQ